MLNAEVRGFAFDLVHAIIEAEKLDITDSKAKADVYAAITKEMGVVVEAIAEMQAE